ncbi:MAG: DUF5694 domain-containing protein [Fimbriimonadales bacterium]|nr:DUF5694 domain-containing protein [Fimbriimonadales bacterium]
MSIVRNRPPFRAPIAEREKTHLLILGTPHLAGYDFEVAALEPLLNVLERFKPDLVGVEWLHPQVIEWMELTPQKHGGTVERFAQRIVELGRMLQKQLGISRVQAELITEERLASLTPNATPMERTALIGYLLAAYDYVSALLQWSYLPEEFRAQDQWLPAEVRRSLEQALQSKSEDTSIGVALARRRQLQRIYQIDDHQDGDLFLRTFEQFLREMQASKEVQAMEARFKALMQQDRHRFERVARQGNLLPLYLYYNSPEYAEEDMEQWRVWFRTRFASGLDRARMAAWEVRNLNMASHIRRAMAHHPGGRMVVIVGASHKPFLEAYLPTMVDVKLVEFRSLLSRRELRELGKDLL